MNPSEQTVELQLPSGAEILVRRPTPFLFAVCGEAIRMNRELRGESGEAITDAHAVDIAHGMGAVLVWTCVKPRLSLKPHGPDEMHPDQMPFEDAVFIIKWAMRSLRSGPSGQPHHKAKFRHQHVRKGN